MQTLTFTQLLLRQRRFLSFLLPLFALFVGLSSATTASAQVVLSGQQVIVNQGNGNVTYAATAFDGSKLLNQTSGATSTAFDINGTIPNLKGGLLTTAESNGYKVTGAKLTYQVYDASFSPTTNGTIDLSTDGTVTAGGVRTFTLSSANVNLLKNATTSGNNYYVAVSYSASYSKSGFPPVGTQLDPTTYYASFDVSGVKAPDPTISANTITFDPNGVPPAPPVTNPPTPLTPNPLTTFNINPSTPRKFDGADLSDPNNGGNAYDINNGQLLLKGTTVTTTEAGANIITSVILYYRTRAINSGGGAFQPITLTEAGNVNGGMRTFVLDSAQSGSSISQPNLIATPAVTQAGTYVVDVYYQANGYNSATGNSFSITDPPTANSSYSANFTVTGQPIQTTIWTGGKNDNWFDAANWSNGVPTPTVNALIRDLGAGVAVPYPNIYSGVKNISASGALLYDNTLSGPAQCLNLTMSGSSQAARSITRLIAGRLKVYGDFNNLFDSFIQREYTRIEFSGTNQMITGGTFANVDISGGGIKRLTGVMNVSESLNFLTVGGANAGVLETDITKPTVSVVVLADRTVINNNNGAQLTGEDDQSYLHGFARTSRAGVLVGEARTYGNMGMDITFTGKNGPGNVDVTRNTWEAYSPINTNYGIRRIFGVRPSDPQTNNGGLTATMTFHYRDSETMRLAGATTRDYGTGSIPEKRLTMFVSTNSGNTFMLVGRDGPVDEVNNTVTKTGVRTFATFTLGDQNNPLPVRLTSFDAKRLGADALITWQTATEQNSKGYDVQVSTNGTEFRTLVSVPSASPNSVKLTSYSYTDTEKNKSGTRYYRLRQIDLDGKDAFFSPVAVSFDGKATASTLVAYPNPFNGNDELHVALQSTIAGKGQLLITDMTGRTIRQEAVEVTTGITDFAVTNMADLKAGLYLVKFTLPSGEVKNLKVMKQ